MLPWVQENDGVELGPGIKERMAIAGAITNKEVELAEIARAEFVAAVRAMIQPGTVMVVPSAPCTVSAYCGTQHSAPRPRTCRRTDAVLVMTDIDERIIS